MSDQILVKECLKGRSEAFSTLVNRYQERVYKYILKRINVPQVTEELVQETFIKAYRALSQLKDPEAFDHWIFTIAKNCSYSWLRNRKKEQFVEISDSFPSKTDSIYDADYLSALDKAVGMLPEEVKAIIHLKYYDGKSCEEIARVLRKPIGTVMSHLSRCYKHIRKQLAIYYRRTQDDM